MVSTAQTRLAHYIATIGLASYTTLITAMEKRSPEVETYKSMRQVFDQPAAEQTLLEMYYFARRAVEWTGTSFGKASWIWMRRHHSPATYAHYAELSTALQEAAQRQGIDPTQDDTRLNEDADRYLLERIGFCLQGDPYANEWRVQQVEANLNYDFWWTGLDAKEAQAWKQAHPRSKTNRLWKVPTGHPETPLVCLPGTLEETLASTKRALAALEVWTKRFGIWEQESGQQILEYYATQGIQALDDGFLLGCFGRISRGHILDRVQQDIKLYTQGAQRMREASVPFMLCRPVDTFPLRVKRNLEEWNDFIEFLDSLQEVPVAL